MLLSLYPNLSISKQKIVLRAKHIWTIHFNVQMKEKAKIPKILSKYENLARSKIISNKLFRKKIADALQTPITTGEKYFMTIQFQ